MARTATAYASVIQEDFSAGIQRDVAPHLIDPRGIFDCVNGLYDDDGSIYRRGGAAYLAGAGFGSAGLRFIADLFTDAGRRTVVANSSDFGVLSSDDSTVATLGSDGLTLPAAYTFLAGLMFIGGGYVYGGSRKTAAYSTGTVATATGSKTVTGSGTTFSTNADAGMLFQVGNERVYTVASVDSNTQLTLRDNYEGSTASGLSYAVSPIYKITGADPYDAVAAPWTCANRLVWGVGSRVKFSPVDNPNSVGANDYHELPEGAQIVGGAAVGDTSLIFTNEGVWTLSGLPFEIVDPATGNPQHRLRSLSRDIVLAGPTGIGHWQQALVVPAVDGVYLMDGVSTPEKISKPIDDLYTPYIEQGLRPGGAIVSHRHYILPIIDTTGEVHDTLVCRLDRPVKSRGQITFPWSRLADMGANVPAYATRIGSPVPDPSLLGAENNTTSKVLDCSAFFAPDASHKADQDGTAHAFDIITRDFETGNKTKNLIRRVRPRYQMVDASSDDPILDVLYSLGETDPTAPYWGAPNGEWGTGFGPSGTSPWTSSIDSSYATACSLPEDRDGTNPQRCRIGKQSRYIRYRVRTSDPCAKLTLRSLETFIRPAGSVMR